MKALNKEDEKPRPSKARLPSVVLPHFEFDLSEFKRRLQAEEEHRVGQLSKSVRGMQKKKLFMAISEQNSSKLREDCLIKPFFVAVNKERYTTRFNEYLALLFKEDSFVAMEDLKRVHSFGITSETYQRFKQLLFTTIYQVEDCYVSIGTLFEGSRRVERMRPCIATKNEMFEAVPLKQLSEELRTLWLTCGYKDSGLLDPLLSFCFTSFGLGELLGLISSSDTVVDKGGQTMLKTFLWRAGVTRQVNSLVVFTAIENVRYLRDQLLSSQYRVIDFIRYKYKTFSAFVQKALARLKAVAKTRREQRAAELLLYHLLDISEVCFHHRQVARMLEQSRLTQQFVNQLFVGLLDFLKEEDFPDLFYGEVVSQSKMLRRLLLKAEPSYEKVRKLAKLLESQQSEGLAKRGVKLCCPYTVAFYAYKLGPLSKDEIGRVHAPLRISKQNYEYVGYRLQSRVQLEGSEDEAARLKEVFQKYQQFVVHS